MTSITGSLITTRYSRIWGSEYRADLRFERSLTTPAHYAYLKISEGCNRTCSFCVIPIITGKHRSKSIEDLETEVKLLVKKGVKEFQLIAQDLSYYGIDRYKTQKLPELIERLSDIPGVEWLRLHYAYPAHFPYDVLRVMRERENVCKYLDIALQHISDNMLKQMKRNLSKAQTYELIERIRKKCRNTHQNDHDGWPSGETDADFDELLDFYVLPALSVWGLLCIHMKRERMRTNIITMMFRPSLNSKEWTS